MKCFVCFKEGNMRRDCSKLKKRADMLNVTNNMANIAEESTNDTEAILCVTIGLSEDEWMLD